MKTSFKHKFVDGLMAMIFGILIVLSTPTIFAGSPILHQVSAQTENQSMVVTEEEIEEANVEQNQEQLPSQEGFTTKTLATNLSAPHNILYGPDDALWITERVGKEITRIDPNNGEELSIIPVPNVHQSGGQDGLMGMAFDPEFNSTNYIYVAYTYDEDIGEELDRRTAITRFTYDPVAMNISEPLDLISGLSGSVDHNSGRLIFGPDGKLYYTIGDQGKNQFSLYCFNIEAQLLPTAEQVASGNWDAYEGKVLRMNPDGTIPDDNPVINGVKSHIYTYGHRNPQGIAFGSNGDLYISEHGDKSDDEVNRLQTGGNYGWPHIQGYNDSQAYQYANWSTAQNCEDLQWSNITPPPENVPVMDESEFDAENFVPPVTTFYTVEDNYNFTDPACGEMAYICWPTVAPSSLRLYEHDAIPGWENTLLMPTLKGGRIFQLALNENGTALAGEPVELFRSENRYRDLAFSPDGQTIYAITDSFGPVQALQGGASIELGNPGSVLAFKYNGGNSTG